MTDLLSRLSSLEEKATPAPWAIDPTGDIGTWFVGNDEHCVCECQSGVLEQPELDDANAALIVALRNSWPSLKSRLEAADVLAQEADRLVGCNDAVEADAYCYDAAEIPMSCVVALRDALSRFRASKEE